MIMPMGIILDVQPVDRDQIKRHHQTEVREGANG
jgi:hypothetical protein